MSPQQCQFPLRASSPPVESSTHTHGLIALHHSSGHVLFRIPIHSHRELATSLPLPTRPSLSGSNYHRGPYTKRILSEMTEILDGEADQQISPGADSSPVRHAHSLCCSCSLLVSSLTAQLGLYVPFCTPCPSSSSHTGLPTTVQILQVTKDSSASCLAMRREYLSLINDIGHSTVDQPSGAVVPRTQTSSSLAVQSFIAPRIHAHL